MMGARGLNTVPDARMDKVGTLRAQVATIDPYLNMAVGVQAAQRLHINLRQSAEVSGLNDDAKRLYPGIDLKIGLLEESKWTPAVALGLQSAIGHKRMAGEYLALSKRYEDFDFTGGIAWGRLGSAAQMSNPLKAVSDHFGRARDLNGEMPNGPEDWFTGPDVGFFAGVAWDTPYVDGLTLKADWGADRYIVEKTLTDYDAPDPWAIGFDYSPREWVKAGLSLIGGEKLMGSLSFQSPVQKWIGRGAKDDTAKPMRRYRTGIPEPQAMVTSASAEGLVLEDALADGPKAEAKLAITPGAATPRQIGRAARHISDHAGEDVEAITLHPTVYGLQGAPVTIMRADMERALVHGNGSASEIWQNASLDEIPKDSGRAKVPHGIFFRREFLTFALDQKISLSEEDQGLLYRTSLLGESREMLTKHIVSGASLRVNALNNLEKLNEYRMPSLLPVRGNEDEFAKRTLGLERSYLGFMKSLNTDLHFAASMGYLEEMYAGIGGEVLYRPFGKRFAVGAESWLALKRDPSSMLNMALNGDHLLSGHVQAWYEIPDTDMTVQARVGRYLAEDFGGTLSVTNRFENGAKLEAFVTATNAADFDVFGGTTHVFSGLRLNLPIGNMPVIPAGSEVRISALPMGRDAGQAIDSPLPLYELTEAISYRHIAGQWAQVTD